MQTKCFKNRPWRKPRERREEFYELNVNGYELVQRKIITAAMSSVEPLVLFDELLDCVESDDVDKLHECLRKKEYAGTSFFEAKINEREETLLHYACRHCKSDIMEYLLSNSICNTLSKDCNGNTPLHLLLKTILLIDLKEDFTKGMTLLKSSNQKH